MRSDWLLSFGSHGILQYTVAPMEQWLFRVKLIKTSLTVSCRSSHIAAKRTEDEFASSLATQSQEVTYCNYL